jgi:hypothetical protein
MAAVDDLDEVLEQFKLAGNEFMKGNPKPVQDLFSHREDVSLANPFGPPVRGWEQVAERQELRPEDDTWKVVHRHADPITTARPAESVLQEE